MSVTCFRYTPANVSDVEALNRKLVPVLQAGGEAFLTGTELDGLFVLRACVVNFRTTEADLDRLLDAIVDAATKASDQA